MIRRTLNIIGTTNCHIVFLAKLFFTSEQTGNNHGAGLLGKWIAIFVSLLKLLLWPVRKLSVFLFPYRDTDGLSPAVTAKAANQFVSYLRSLNNTNNHNIDANTITNAFSSSGFATLKQEALASQSLLFVYLHSPLHASSKQFCTRVLLSEPLLNLVCATSRNLNDDAPTAPSTNNKMLATGLSIHTSQGAQLQNLLQITSFPAVVVLQPPPGASASSATLHLVGKAEGPHQCHAAVLLPMLRAAQHRHATVLSEFYVRRLYQQQESELRRQQDEEYQATLWADQERERQQRELEETERSELLSKDRLLREAQALVTPEPASGTPGITMVRFVLPAGKKINRRFVAAQTTIQGLKAFVRLHCHENQVEMGTIGLSTSFPRKTYNETKDDLLTLEEASLVPQAVLMVQDLDA